MIIPFHNFKDDLWIDLKRIDVTTTWVDYRVGYRLDPWTYAEWMTKTALLSTDNFAPISPNIYEGAELYYSQYDPKKHIHIRANCHNSERDDCYIFLKFDVHRVHFKSGVVLKTKDDICLHFFPTYRTTDMDDFGREKRRLNAAFSEKNLRLVNPPQLKRR